MSCLKAPKLPKPDLSLLLPALPQPPDLPHLGLSLCCEIPEKTIRNPLKPIPLPPPLAILLSGPVMIAIMTAIDEINGLLDQIQVDCPLE